MDNNAVINDIVDSIKSAFENSESIADKLVWADTLASYGRGDGNKYDRNIVSDALSMYEKAIHLAKDHKDRYALRYAKERRDYLEVSYA